MYSWTTLRVKWRGTLRGGYGVQTGGWGAWNILFNGNDCSNPGKIEGFHYNAESDTDHHKATGSKFKKSITVIKFEGLTPLKKFKKWPISNSQIFDANYNRRIRVLVEYIIKTFPLY